jgi:DNA polymerase-4
MFVSGPPTILHADLDAFFASVEQRDDGRLLGLPVIVGGGVVLACSYEAKARGVRSGMGGRKARELCPDAIVVSPHFEAYVEASREVAAIFKRTAPVVERVSIDEAYLDVRGLEAICGTAALRRTVRGEVGLPISVGVASTKALAKIASGLAKPDGLLVVAPEEELAFLHPLPVERLWGVGPATARRLHAAGLKTVGDIARTGEEALMALLGPHGGRHFHAVAHNRVVRPVVTGRRRRSIGSQRALGMPGKRPDELDPVLAGLADRVTRRMRRAGHAGRTVVLRLRFDDFTRATRSRTLPRPTCATARVLATLRALLADARPVIASRTLTLVGVTVTNLETAFGQLVLPLHGADGAALDAALDEIRDRYGTHAVTRAALLDSRDTLATFLAPGE